MAKFKPLNENQLVMLPISLQNQIVPGTLEHTISRVVDEHIDLSVFDARYNNDETGATAIVSTSSTTTSQDFAESYSAGLCQGND